MQTLLVKAANGLKYPLQGQPNKYITEAEAVSVEDTAYYRKALLDGDLVAVSTQPAADATADDKAIAVTKSK